MPARKATSEYRIEYRLLSDAEWRHTDEHFESLELAQLRLRRFHAGAKRLAQRRVQASDWEPITDD